MTAPDPKILAEGIAEAEKGLAIFRPFIDQPGIKREVEFSEAFVAAAKAYGPMREALNVVRASAGWQHMSEATRILVRAALNLTGPA